jgi:hypothetical protein
MHAGLWKAWLLPMFRGEKTPAKPAEPAKVHTINKVEVPYTPEEMKVRTEAYKRKKAIWDKTMKVIIMFPCKTTYSNRNIHK